ncbi:GGDEF domain-containing protein [Mycolicibacterium thermoresistibile]|nr:GGDEF domain-containing protein [Mycolicibacterium thermoresistibile]
MAPLDAMLRRRMLVAYLLILLVLYALAVGVAVAVDTPPSDARGEVLAVLLCVVGVAAATPRPLRGRRYVTALGCAGAAPTVALLFHDQIAGQSWSVVPPMFMAVFLHTWHRGATARVASGAIAVAAATALLIAPAPVPIMWVVLYVVCIPGAGEVYGLASSALFAMALHDPLTTVWNRAGVELKAEQIISRARRRGRSVAVIVLDVDDFKTINDRDGHLVGDAVLVELTRRWAARVPASAALGRVGGDEFVVIASCDQHRAGELAAELVDGQAVHVSYGVAVGPADKCDFATLFAAADADLYRRKRSRKAVPGR